MGARSKNVILRPSLAVPEPNSEPFLLPTFFSVELANTAPQDVAKLHFFAEVVVGTCLDQTAKFGRLNCSQVRAGRAAAAAVRMGVSSMNIFY